MIPRVVHNGRAAFAGVPTPPADLPPDFAFTASRLWDHGKGLATLDEAAIAAHIQRRADAKAGKDFALADQIRKELLTQGVVLKDSPAGTTWEVAQ